MDKINLLKSRRETLLANSKETREKISALIDNESLVELSSYSFSKNEFYSDEEQGEGVITGLARIDDQPCYVIAQNAKVCSGGLSKANCDKIVKALQAAIDNTLPVVYLLESKGVQVGEGINALEGIAEVLWMSSLLETTQIALVDGEVYGSLATLVAGCDFVVYTKNACLSYASPAVIAATEKLPKTKEEIGGVKSLENIGLQAVVVEDLKEAKQTVSKLFALLSETIDVSEEDLNRTAPALNEKVCASCLTKAVFDNNSFVELGASYCPSVKTVIGSIGGFTVGAVIFDGGEEGVELTSKVMKKINRFAGLVADYEMPLVNFVNTKGIAKDFAVSQSDVLIDISNYIYNTNNIRKLSVVYGKAIGLGYTVFAAKKMRNDLTVAFPDAQISLFDSLEGAYVEYKGVTVSDEAKFAEKYRDENQDAFNAAKDGYIDNIIEPQFVRQYLISCLQILS